MSRERREPGRQLCFRAGWPSVRGGTRGARAGGAARSHTRVLRIRVRGGRGPRWGQRWARWVPPTPPPALRKPHLAGMELDVSASRCGVPELGRDPGWQCWRVGVLGRSDPGRQGSSETSYSELSPRVTLPTQCSYCFSTLILSRPVPSRPVPYGPEGRWSNDLPSLHPNQVIKEVCFPESICLDKRAGLCGCYFRICL